MMANRSPSVGVPWLATLLWLALGALSIALRHPWLGGFVLANVALSAWLRLLKFFVYENRAPQKESKEQRLRATILMVALLSGVFAIARALSPLWR